VTLKIEKTLVEHGTTIKLIGRIRAEHLSEIKAQVSASKPKIVLDLGEVLLVDADAVRFLGSCESESIQLLNRAALGDQQPDRAAISWRERAGKIRILETDRVSVRSDAPAIADFR
jgi:translation initiation factor IF-1